MKKLIIMMFVAIAASLTTHAERTALTQQVTSTDTVKQEDPLAAFDAFQFSYFGGFSSFDKGYYGVGFERFAGNGVFSLSFHGSWGITDPGLYQGRIAYGYAYGAAPWLALVVKGTVILGDCVSDVTMTSKGKLKYETEFGGGLLASPGIRLRLDKLTIGVNADLGWAYFHGSGFYKDLMLSLGFKI